MPDKPACVVVLGVSSDLACAGASVLMDLAAHSPGLVADVVVYHDGLTRRERRLMAAIRPVRFERFRLPARLRRRLHPQTLHQFTELVFSKYECLRLLADYRAAVWLDIDQVVRRDLAALARPCPAGLRIVPSPVSVRTGLREPVPGYDLDAPTICASVFAVYDTLSDPAGLYRWFRGVLAEHGRAVLHEQPAFDFAIQRLGLRFEPLPVVDYCCHPREPEAATAAVLHTYGQPKFWNGWENEQWNANYARWLRMGGPPYRPRRPGWLRRLRARIGRLLGRGGKG